MLANFSPLVKVMVDTLDYGGFFKKATYRYRIDDLCERYEKQLGIGMAVRFAPEDEERERLLEKKRTLLDIPCKAAKKYAVSGPMGSWRD